MGIKDVASGLSRQLGECRRQNAKLRALALHACGAECERCRLIVCPERERLFKDAFSRQLLNLRTPPP